MLDFAPLAPPHYVYRVVHFQITLLSISLQSKAANVKDAQVLAKKLCKPSTLETKALKELFPAASYGGKRQTRPFDPTSECCASSSQKKKKAANAQGRVTNVQVMLLKDYIPNIPRGKFRNELKSQGRVQTLQFRRSMSPLEMHSGVPEQHKQFWSDMGCGQLYSVYTALQASPQKLLMMLDDVVCMNPNQESVFSYLRQFIGNMQADEVRSFLRFVTGSAACSTNALQVTFNMLTGLARRPIAHTCSYTLELSATYQSYQEFANDFKAVLNAQEFVWVMDGI